MSQPPSTLQLSTDDLLHPRVSLKSSTIKTQCGKSSWESDSDSQLFPQHIPEDVTTQTELLQADTIHHLSPASFLSPRTDNEGDVYDYTSPDFVRLIQGYAPKDVDERSLETSYISCVEPQLQRTVAIVRPEAMPFEDVILRAVHEAGFSIIHHRHIHMTPEQVSELYVKHYGTPEFPHLVVSMSVDPLLVLSLADLNAVNKWKELIGPDKQIQAEWFYPVSMRKRFGLREAIPDALHASDTLNDSSKENRYFFPESVIEPLIHEEEKVWDYCGLYLNNTLMEGCTELVRVKPIEPILFLAEWLLLNNPFQPRYPSEVAVLPT